MQTTKRHFKKRCSAKNCTVNEFDNPDVKLYAFPKNTERFNIWKKVALIEEGGPCSFLCHRHFAHNQFRAGGLMYGANPSYPTGHLNELTANYSPLYEIQTEMEVEIESVEPCPEVLSTSDVSSNACPQINDQRKTKKSAVDVFLNCPDDCSWILRINEHLNAIGLTTGTKLKYIQTIQITGPSENINKACKNLSTSQLHQISHKCHMDKSSHYSHKILQNQISNCEQEMAQMKAMIQKMAHSTKEDNQEIKSSLKTMQDKLEYNTDKKDLSDDEDVVDIAAFKISNAYTCLNKWGKSPLHIACWLGRLDVLKELIKIDVGEKFTIEKYLNIKDKLGWTPLMFAVDGGHMKIVKYLISKNVSINVKEVDGYTALSWAVFTRRRKIVEYLCSVKADVNIINCGKQTALGIARREGYTEIVKILEQYATT